MIGELVFKKDENWGCKRMVLGMFVVVLIVPSIVQLTQKPSYIHSQSAIFIVCFELAEGNVIVICLQLLNMNLN